MKLRRHIPEMVVGVFFPAFVLWLVPFRQVFEFDFDEGINIMKAILVGKGFPLYSMTWSDQPPLVTWILAGSFRLFGVSVVHARLVVLFFATALVVCFFSLLRDRLGPRAAFVGVAALLVSHSFFDLSVSVMIGMVSLSFFVMSLWTFDLSAKKSSSLWSCVSGSLAALSLFSKFFTAPFILILAFESLRKPGRAVPWVGGFLSLSVFLGLFCGLPAFNQILLTQINVYGHPWSYVNSPVPVLMDDLGLLAIGVMGLFFQVRSRDRKNLFPVLLLVAGLLIIGFHRPFEDG